MLPAGENDDWLQIGGASDAALCSLWSGANTAKRMAMSSVKKRTKIVMSAMPSTQEYSVIGPVRHGFVRASLAGARSWLDLALRLAIQLPCRRISMKLAEYASESGRETSSAGFVRTWIKAVAMMTPEPKYFATKKAHLGTPIPLCR